jgi:indole-3-acetate monooxygenase
MSAAATSPVEAAQAIAPVIREHADAIERDRCLPPPVLQGLIEADLFRLLAPRAYGGAEADPATVCRMVAGVAGR